MIADTPADAHYQIHSSEQTPAHYESVESWPGDTVARDLGLTSAVFRGAPYPRYVFVPGDDTPVERRTNQRVADGIATSADERAAEARLQFGGDQNRIRLTLLAREFARKQLGPEDAARLEVVSARVRALFPRVTARDFEDVERSVLEAHAVAARDAELRRELGLDE